MSPLSTPMPTLTRLNVSLSLYLVVVAPDPYDLLFMVTSSDLMFFPMQCMRIMLGLSAIVPPFDTFLPRYACTLSAPIIPLLTVPLTILGFGMATCDMYTPL